MKYSIVIIVLVLILAITSCSSSKALKKSKQVFLELEEGSCFGKCKAFKVVLYKDGSFTYTEDEKSFDLSLSSEEMKMLKDEIKSMKFSNLDSEYFTRIADLQKHTIIYNDHKVSFHVKDSPRPLRSFYAMLKEKILEKL